MADKIVKDLSDDFLNCSICMSHFETPKMLPCIHSFCQECLLKYANTQKGNDIACPTCRKVCTLPESGVKSLQTNFHLVNLAEKVTLLEKLTPTEKKSRACNSCKHKEVVAFCFDCNFAFCSKCKDQHALFPALRTHSVVLTEDITDPKFQTGWRKATSPFCEVHSSEKLNFYCKTCSKLICRDCTIVMHVKPDHEYLDVVTQVGTTKETLTTLLEKSNDNLTKGINYIKRGKESSKGIKKASGELKVEIAAHCLKQIAEVEKMLHDQKSSLLKIVENVESRKIDNIEEKLQIAEDWVERMKNAQGVTQHVIQEDNPWELLGMSAELTNAFETLQIESEEFYWFYSDIHQSVMFDPGHISDFRLGECDFTSETVTVVTDACGNFILCQFEYSNKTLYLSLLLKSSNYNKTVRFPPYQWKHEIPTGGKLKVTARHQDFLYVAQGRVVATFNCNSKECVNEMEIFDNSEPPTYISCMAYSSATNEVFLFCCNQTTLYRFDTSFHNSRTHTLQFPDVTFLHPYKNDVLCGNGQGELHKYDLEEERLTILSLNPPPGFQASEIVFYEGLWNGQRTLTTYPQHTYPNQRDTWAMYDRNASPYWSKSSRTMDTPRPNYTYTDDFVCFIVWGNSNRWVLKEYCTKTDTFIGVLDDLGGGNVEIPSALYCERLDNDGVAIHLCDSQGSVASYKRDGNQNNPATYQKFDPQ